MGPSEEAQLAFVCFRDVSWLQCFELNASSALEYFSMSQFYDRTSNNEVLRMQSRFTDNQSLADQLHTMKGTEFVLLRAAPPKLFVIGKRERRDATHTTLLSAYYILDGSIYMAPDLYSIVSSRLISSMHYFNDAILYARQSVEFDPASGRYVAKSDASSASVGGRRPTADAAIERIISDVIAEEMSQASPDAH